MPEVVLMVTDRCDVSADHVVTELDGRRVPVFRVRHRRVPSASVGLRAAGRRPFQQLAQSVAIDHPRRGRCCLLPAPASHSA
jgi:hypothetical protein